MEEFKYSNFSSIIQASHYERLREEGYEYVDDKGDTVIVGLPSLHYEWWRPHTVEIKVTGDMVYHYL